MLSGGCDLIESPMDGMLKLKQRLRSMGLPDTCFYGHSLSYKIAYRWGWALCLTGPIRAADWYVFFSLIASPLLGGCVVCYVAFLII